MFHSSIASYIFHAFLILITSSFLISCKPVLVETKPALVETDKAVDLVKADGLSLKDLSALIGANKDNQVRDLLRLAVKSRNDCLKHNGRWGPQGRARQPGCIIPTEDAGNACSSSSQCQSYCILTGDKGLKHRRGERVQGQCDSTNRRFGCRFYVENGVYIERMCVD